MPKHAFVPASLGELSVLCSPGVAWAPELLGSRCVVDEVGLPVKQKKVIFAHFSVFSSPGSEGWVPLHMVWVWGALLSGTGTPDPPARDGWQG